MGDVADAVAGAFRDEWGRVVATLIRTTGDWDLAEECAQEAFTQAIERWRVDGVPTNPGAWLTTVGRNRAFDRLRRTKLGEAKVRALSAAAHMDDDLFDDDQLRLIFTCCHPALPLEARVALTLRTLAGLTTAEIARAFLVNEETMAKRLTRAKAKIQNAGIPYRVPPPELLAERTNGVLAVLYLLFNEGYNASIRQELCDEAIRLTAALATLMPNEMEVVGLLSLMELHNARRHGRIDANGDLVTLEEQDRSTWDLDAIRRAVTRVEDAERRGDRGPYQLQAAIAACHAVAPVAAATDWPRIAALYDQLVAVMPTPVARLNRAVAVGMAFGPDSALALIDELSELDGFYLLHASRGDFLSRAGRHTEAAAAFTRAASLAPSDTERRYLHRRAGHF